MNAYCQLYTKAFDYFMGKGLAGCWKCSNPKCYINNTKTYKVLMLVRPRGKHDTCTAYHNCH